MLQVTYTIAVGNQTGGVILERGGAMEFDTTADLTMLSNVVGGAAAIAAQSMAKQLRAGLDKVDEAEAKAADLDVLDDVADVLRAMGYESAPDAQDSEDDQP